MFSKLHLLVLGTLCVLCVVLAIALTTQGPRLSRTMLNETAGNQRYVLSFTTPIQPESLLVSINPEIEHETAVEGRTVYIRFLKPLSYDTDYNISLNVTDTSGANSRVTSSFSTTNPTLFYIKRNATEPDELRRTTIQAGSDTVIFSHDNILAHTVSSRSHMVAVSENDSIKLIHISRRQKEVTLPEGYQLRSMDGSSRHDRFIFTLQDQSLATSGWEYDPRKQQWNGLVSGVGGSLLGSIVKYAPDGQSLYYFDQNSNLVLNDPTDERDPTILGVYDSVARFLPNQKAILASRTNSFMVIPQNGSSEEAPERVQVSFQPQLLQSLTDYVYITQRLDASSGALTQYLIRLNENGSSEVLASEATANLLILSLDLSPNDQYIVTEEAWQPVVYDMALLNNKPGIVSSVIRNTATGEVLLTLDGFDVIWR